MKKSKKPMIIIGIVIVLCLVGAGIFALTANSAGRRLTEQLELGRKYLEEMDYEQAIVAFEAAIAIDPKCEEAYLALAETYVAQGTGDSGVYLPGEDIYVAAENVEKAMEVLEEGYSQTSSETISTRLEELRECYQVWEEGGESAAENGPGAGGQDTDGSQASGSSQSGSSQTPSSSEAGNQGQPAIDENDPLVQFLNAPFTDENGFGNVTSLGAARAYADENGFAAGSDDFVPMGDLYIYYEDSEYIDGDTDKLVKESVLQIDTTNDIWDEGDTYTIYGYDREVAQPACSVCTYLGDRDTMTGETVPPVGGFAGFLAEYNCLSVESILQTIGLDDEKLLNSVRMDNSQGSLQMVTAYGTVDIEIFNYTAFTIDAVNRSLSITFPENSGAPWGNIYLGEGVTRSPLNQEVTYYLMVKASGGSATE